MNKFIEMERTLQKRLSLLEYQSNKDFDTINDLSNTVEELDGLVRDVEDRVDDIENDYMTKSDVEEYVDDRVDETEIIRNIGRKLTEVSRFY